MVYINNNIHKISTIINKTNESDDKIDNYADIKTILLFRYFVIYQIIQ